MDSSNAPPSANGPPPKPWERAGSSSGPAPFKPPSAGSTSDVVEASGTARPGEIVSSADRSTPNNRNTLGRPVPSRPWEQNYGSSNTYGGYGTGMSGVTGMSGTYGSYGGTGGLYGGTGGLYGGGMYGNSMYRGGYGGAGGLYGGSSGMYGAGSMYGGGMYNSGMGGPMGGYGMGMGGPYGGQDPNDPYGAPPSAPGFWVSALHVLQGVVSFFGRIAILIDQNTQAFHLFMTALLQLFDRSGLLYGELARFVLRILGVRTKPKMGPPSGPNGLPFHGPNGAPENRNYIEGPKAAPSGSWDNVWGNDTSK
ncbi:PREDICTED: peroxisomal membrane protein 13 isoform X2 [Fragaria vesca subsp. vesca]|uniref:peroxisomal membrane protein 13 isoform X2 n=1 Tax=Fragaria vesca subsp. vesca TaxID=101020 RepID=UPI0002C33649|nr:PREDICTED: peroxisomal membrane protein 13 isoform X2 [Fragaria vesca subsp. vesca]